MSVDPAGYNTGFEVMPCLMDDATYDPIQPFPPAAIRPHLMSVMPP
jgi:hypothetical protein